MLLLCLDRRETEIVREHRKALEAALRVEGDSPEVNSDECGATNHRWLAKEPREKKWDKVRTNPKPTTFSVRIYPSNSFHSHTWHTSAIFGYFHLRLICRNLFIYWQTQKRKKTPQTWLFFFLKRWSTFSFSEVILLQSLWFDIGRHLAKNFYLAFAYMLTV